MPTFIPGLEQSPIPYEQCPTLAAPQPPLTLTGLAYRIMLFSRERIVDCGARILWGDFLSGSPSTDEDIRRAWARSLAAPLMVLGLMYGKPAGSGGSVITVQEFLNLEWELFQLPDFHRPNSDEADGERDAIEARLASSRLKKVGSLEVANVARVIWNLSHATNEQLADTDANPLRLARDWAVYQKIREQYGQHGGETDRDFVALERALFLTTPRLFVRAGVDLLARQLEKRPDEDTPGVYFLPKRRDWAGYLPDVSLDDYIALVRNLGIKASDLRSRGDKLLHQGTPENRRAVFEDVRRRPIVVLDDYPDEDEAVLVTGPARLFKAMSRFLLHDTVQHFGTRLDRDSASVRGLAFENYIEDAVAGTGVQRLDPKGRKTPDFEWIGNRYRVLIEAKVKPVPTEMISSPGALVSAWDTLMEAVDQADSYARRFDGPQPDKWLLIIVVNDGYAEEQTCFRHITSHWKLLQQTRLSAVAVLRPDDFEHIVYRLTPDEAGGALEQLWVDAGSRSPLDQPPTVEPYEVTTIPSALDRAYREVFGASALRAVGSSTPNPASAPNQ